MTIFWSFEQSNRRTDGGVQPSGSHNAPDTQQRAIYNFPSKIKSAPAATNASAAQNQNSVAATPLTSRHGRLNSGGESRQSFIQEFATFCVLGITAAWIGCLIVASLYVGKLIVAYLSGGA